MDDTLCQNFDVLRMHLPVKLGGTAKFELKNISDFQNYCPNDNCDTELEKITIGFLWLLGQYFTKYPNKDCNVNDIKPFFLYIILWLSHKLNQITDQNFTKINDFYTNHVINNDKYSNFINDSNRYTNLNEFINGQKDFFNINIKDMSKFYDASKLICSMHDKVARNKHENLSNDANGFVNKYAALNNDCNINGTVRSKIFNVLSTDYNNLKTKCRNISSLPNIKTTQNATKSPEQASASISVTNSEQNSAHKSRVTSSSPIGNKLFTVLSVFGAIAFFLGISYKYSLFGFRKRAQKQYLREKIKNIKKRMNH
ncbi:BIR protein [Plasmodium berghei]|uniref:BIR protein n=2 Tax=Plasmodium berghei TaxID=5821 RepID=A0A509AEG7_PLABA|nr:BIR protein [Plasmodium berghei ANKA]CXH91547.1 BIR protein [Plasmodium berghei]SCL81423.1 BIR protein [Plasmodium berghei]SCL81660.1 BIR protein [Plasmodium berghei]SCM15303.1 BIR protein [Plasmodium berghei]SCN22058.1 BIR protein [Plasmodium berghei]|eukprot:XP_034419889.1 BIR protein [Plasmodium berghei ANKA]